MQFTLLTAVALFAASAFAQDQDLFIGHPKNLTQCGDAKATWSPGKPPYNLIVVKSSDPCGEPLFTKSDITDTFLSFPVNFDEGEVQISVADSLNAEGWSQDVAVVAGKSTSCLAANSPTSSATSNTDAGKTTTPGSTDTTGDSDTTDDDGTVIPIGAANAGTNTIFDNGASARQASGPIMALSAIAALAVLAL